MRTLFELAPLPGRGHDAAAVGRRDSQWLAESDVTQSMMGPPLFPDTPAPTWDEFCEDYGPHFFDGTRQEVGRSYVIGITEFIIRPSRRNRRAIHAYAKAGFTLLPLTNEQQVEIYGPGDYTDAVVMRKRLPT